MDAGVPMKAHVAGIAMGLIKEGNRFAVLTDILGDEDHLGDMDFKVAGTERGVTALQMDIKIQGITKEIMAVALSQAREGRMHILGKMQEALPHARTEISQHAPRMITFKINPEKIRDVIGKGGAVIRALTEETGTTIDIQDDGTVTIASVNADACDAGEEAHRGRSPPRSKSARSTKAPVLRLLDFGAIVQVLPGKDGLLHISQIAKERVNQVSDYLKEGQVVRVKVLEADDKGRAAPVDEGRGRGRRRSGAGRPVRAGDGVDPGGLTPPVRREGRPRGALFVCVGRAYTSRRTATAVARAGSTTCVRGTHLCVGSDPSCPSGRDQGSPMNVLSRAAVCAVASCRVPAGFRDRWLAVVSEPGMTELLAAGAIAGLVVWVRNRRRK